MIDRALDWIRRRFEPPPRPPTMFRVRDASGTLVDAVDFELRFLPAGRAVRTSKTAAAGLCIVHWPENATAMLARLEVGDEWAEVEVPRISPRPQSVIEVRLAAPT